jgi:hypothetical protein
VLGPFSLLRDSLSRRAGGAGARRGGGGGAGREIFRTCPDRPWGPPSLLYNGSQVSSGGKAARAWR